MIGIILAAGKGSRLLSKTKNLPKCLLRVGSKAIVDHQIEALVANHINNIAVVVGFKADIIIKYLLKKYPDINWHFVFNPIYHKTNTIYSLWLARHLFYRQDLMYMNGDVLFPKTLISKLINSTHQALLATKIGQTAKEEVKILTKKNGLLKNIGKEINPDDALGEFIGVAKFSKNINADFIKHLEFFVKKGMANRYFEAALDRMAAHTKINLLNIGSMPAIEIDFKSDLKKARQISKYV